MPRAAYCSHASGCLPGSAHVPAATAAHPPPGAAVPPPGYHGPALPSTSLSNTQSAAVPHVLPRCRCPGPASAHIRSLPTGTASPITAPPTALRSAQTPPACGRSECNPTLPRTHPVGGAVMGRSEEHTSELQSHSDLVCRLLLETKKDSTER